MAFVLTAKAQSSASSSNQRPSLAVVIEGTDIIFGSDVVLELAKWDSGLTWDQTGVTWDGLVENDNSRAYINLSGTTNNFSQQLSVDRAGGATSISAMNISLVDKNGEVSRLFSFDNFTEILGKKATVYLGYVNTEFPVDYIPLVTGFIDDAFSSAGRYDFSVTNSENLKRQSLFAKFSTELTSAINDTQVSISVETTEGLIESSDALTSYIRINDEVMEVTQVVDATTFNVIRERLNTIAAPAAAGDTVESVYQLEGDPINLSLKLMLSTDGNAATKTTETITRFVNFNESLGLTNSIVFSDSQVNSRLGLIEGDQVIISGSANNDGTFTYSFSGELDTGESFIAVSEGLQDEVPLTDPALSVRSQYNVLNEGLGFTPVEVDVSQFIDIQNTFGTAFFDYNFLLDDTITDMKTFLDSEVFFPQNIYPVPRKAKASIKYTAPPLSIEQIPVLNTDIITNTEQLRQTRATHKFYYNEVIYKYNYDLLSDRLTDAFVEISNESKSRIPVGNKALQIESRGIVRSDAVILNLTTNANRILQRYSTSATQIKNVRLLYGEGFRLEVGDTVTLGGSDTQLVDLQTGQRSGPLISYEIINKSLSLDGRVSVSLLSTGFNLTGRLGVFSPGSFVGSGSTTTSIIVRNVFDSFDSEPERDKWSGLEGALIRIHSEDYDFDENTTFVRFSPTNPNAIEVEALPSAPLDGYYVELAKYADHQDSEVTDLIKLKYTFVMDQVDITAVASAQEFDVSDVSFLAPGMLVQVHSGDYDRDSAEVTIDTIIGTTITLTQALSFTPLIGDFVEALGFSDNLDGGYRLL